MIKRFVRKASSATECLVYTLKQQMSLLADLVQSESKRLGGLNFDGNGTVSHSARYGREKLSSCRLLRLAMASDHRSISSAPVYLSSHRSSSSTVMGLCS